MRNSDQRLLKEDIRRAEQNCIHEALGEYTCDESEYTAFGSQQAGMVKQNQVNYCKLQYRRQSHAEPLGSCISLKALTDKWSLEDMNAKRTAPELSWLHLEYSKQAARPLSSASVQEGDVAADGFASI